MQIAVTVIKPAITSNSKYMPVYIYIYTHLSNFPVPLYVYCLCTLFFLLFRLSGCKHFALEYLSLFDSEAATDQREFECGCDIQYMCRHKTNRDRELY